MRILGMQAKMLHFHFVDAMRWFKSYMQAFLCCVLLLLASCTNMRKTDLIVEMPAEAPQVDQTLPNALVDAVKKRFVPYSDLDCANNDPSRDDQVLSSLSRQTSTMANENSDAPIVFIQREKPFASIASLIDSVHSHIAPVVKFHDSTLLEPILSLEKTNSTPPSLNNVPVAAFIPAESKALNVGDISRKLAGLDLIGLSPAVVESFRKITMQGWDKLKKSVFDPLRGWRQRCFPAIDANRVFYPFGGPDAAYITQFFPDATVYILVGLETIGSVESAQKILANDNYLQLFSLGMEHFLKKGYFVTSYMERQLSSSKVGVIPAILSQLAQLGFDVLDVKNVGLAENGTICKEGEGRLKLTQIRFQSSVGKKTLFYVRCSLENSNHVDVELLCKFVNSESFITFIKSGAYRLYDTKLFSKLRTFLLKNSTAILQDDTGIPYHFLTESYKITLFGTYNQPSLKTFNAYRQNDLAKAYKDQTIEPLPFRIGYGSSSVPSNLLLAISNNASVQ
jgi:hypothetical protein